MSTTEQLRETLVAFKRENERLRAESVQATLLFRALDSLLSDSLTTDYFAPVFAALRTVFEFTCAMVLSEHRGDELSCIAATPETLVGATWKAGEMFRRVMGGRVVVTLSNGELPEWRTPPAGLTASQPTLYLPICVRDRRGVLILLQPTGGKGFDRNDIALAKKFTLLASHALAARQAAEAGAELRRKQEIETQNIRFDAALNNMTHGLAMFDSEQRLVVCNRQYRQMYRLPDEKVSPGAPLREILEERQRARTFPFDIDGYLAEITAQLASGNATEREIACESGRAFRVVNCPMPNGGWVATHEDITERRRSEEKIRFLALNDALTGIPNRSYFIDQLQWARMQLEQSRLHFAVHVLDLDKFKDVNDTLGHAAGDQLLQETTKRLRAAISDGDVLARLGGDEFAIIQMGRCISTSHATAIEDATESAISLASRIIGFVNESFMIGGHQVNVGASIGIAVAPADGADADDLMKKADLALYGAKTRGRNTYCFFENAMMTEADERLRLERELRMAVARNELEVHYQPIIDASTGVICCVEALVRWRHPLLGDVAPDRFIALAEDSGLIVQLGEWILTTACTEAATWPPHIKLAVNMSPVQFNKSSVLDVICRALEKSGLPPERLEIEVTERLLLDERPEQIAILHQLRTFGVQIALDDFGTGYSSLGYLKTFPFDKIKIDRSFTREVLERSDCAAIACTVINLARMLNMRSVAEGVETPEQFEALRSAGVTEAQGFLFARPLPASKLDLNVSPRELRLGRKRRLDHTLRSAS